MKDGYASRLNLCKKEAYISKTVKLLETQVDHRLED